MHTGKDATTALTFFPQNLIFIYLFICVTSVYKGITPFTRHSNLFKKQMIRSIICMHASGCQRSLKKKQKNFPSDCFGHRRHILYHNKLAFGSESRTQRESACPPFFSCSFIFISTVGLSSQRLSMLTGHSGSNAHFISPPSASMNNKQKSHPMED